MMQCSFGMGMIPPTTGSDATCIKHFFDYILLSCDPSNYSEVKRAFQNMAAAYKPDPLKLCQDAVEFVDYNDLSHQYAYLHRYAPFHTVMVLDQMNEVLSLSQISTFWIKWLSHFQTVKICSLGAGPGTDVIGVLRAFYKKFGLQKCSATLVDVKLNWKNVFSTILLAMERADFCNTYENMTSQYFDWDFIATDLMNGKMNRSFIDAIRSANFITMVKFLSSAGCKETPTFLTNVFTLLRPGSLVLFIDNAAGGFADKVLFAANRCNMRQVYGPEKHVKYVNKLIKSERYGYSSCVATTITVIVIMKEASCNEELPFVSDLPEPTCSLSTYADSKTLFFDPPQLLYSVSKNCVLEIPNIYN